MADAKPAEQAAAPAAPAKKSKLLLIIIAAVVVLAGAGGGAFFMFGRKSAGAEGAANAEGEHGKEGAAAHGAPKAPAIYVKFEPPFVVNFEAKGVMRFLQVTVEVMTRDQPTADLIKQHDPLLRNDLLLLLGNQGYEVISTREGKEQLRAEALQAVTKVIAAEGGDGKKVEQLYFTSFVMQ